jgi:hypothetical protein
MTHTKNVLCTCHVKARPVRQDDEKFYWIHEDGSPARIYHVHKEWESVDCDGKLSGLSNFYPTNGQDQHALWKECVTSEIFYYTQSADLKLTVTDDGQRAEWNESTEEGYSYWELTECSDPYCDKIGNAHQRDHSAEAAGY